LTRYREHRDVYRRDMNRYSVYPRIPKPTEYGSRRLSKGQVVSVEIRDVDENGRGVAYHQGVVIRINGGGTVGDRVKVRIVQVRGEEALAEIVEMEK